jgi:hypothetical protein
LTPYQIELLRGSLEVLAHQRDRTLTIYLDRLGSLDPAVLITARRVLDARGTLRHMARLHRLMDWAASPHLNSRQGLLARYVRRARASAAGAELDVMAAAWLLTLELILDAAWTIELETAWIAFLGRLFEDLRGGS